VGRPGGLEKPNLDHARGGIKRFRTLRAKVHVGDPAAIERLRGHVLKWHRRLMKPHRIAKRLGMPEWQVNRFIAESTPADLTPRLVKGGA